MSYHSELHADQQPTFNRLNKLVGHAYEEEIYLLIKIDFEGDYQEIGRETTLNAYAKYEEASNTKKRLENSLENISHYRIDSVSFIA